MRFDPRAMLIADIRNDPDGVARAVIRARRRAGNQVAAAGQCVVGDRALRQESG
jgi:hypothetical protein